MGRHNMPTFTDFDLYLIGAGKDRQAYSKLGAHPRRQNGGAGVDFAVWAPNASAVSVVGDFNQWEPGNTALLPTGDSGIWQGAVEGIGPGALYKFALRSRSGRWTLKSDPYAFAMELRPGTASIVADLDSFTST